MPSPLPVRWNLVRLAPVQQVLFLDEPTNNLDIESIDALCTAVTEVGGVNVFLFVLGRD